LEQTWNLWHGCHKISEGCLNCYVYREDNYYGRSADICEKTHSFDLPLKKKRNSEYLLPSGSTVWTCFTSDFFLEDADDWRKSAWDMIRSRPDLYFIMVTKRILRAAQCFPPDWNDGWDNVEICCTCENQKRADERLPCFLKLPIKHRSVICEPCLEYVDFSSYLDGKIQSITVGGESGAGARICDYSWVLGIRDDCIRNKTSFNFKQTGSNFRKDGITYHIRRADMHIQALKAGINCKF
jgi:protein gp37